jgi:SET domain-containing protein
VVDQRERDVVVASTGSLYVARSPVSGRGVFAARAFAAGETIEVCPVLTVRAGRARFLEESGLAGYYFDWKQGLAIALGYGSLYNHSWRPNARYDHDYDEAVVVYSAVRDVAAGEEVTVNYGGDPDAREDLWFDAGPPPD